MWTDEQKLEFYTSLYKVDKLGDLFNWAFENEFEYEEEYGDYFAIDGGEGAEALRIVYLNLWYEDLICESDKREVEYAVSWRAPEEPTSKSEVVNAFLGLSTFKYLGIDSVEKIVDYLNDYPVNPMIRANSTVMFSALRKNGYIVNHQLIFFGNEKKEMNPFEPYKFDHLFKLNLELEPVGADPKTISMASGENLYINRCNPDDIVELDSEVAFCLGHSTDRNWILYEQYTGHIPGYPRTLQPRILVAYNVNHGRKIKYKGSVVSHDKGIVILQHKNALYRVDGNQITKIYTLDKKIPEYADGGDEWYGFRRKRLLIGPAIRGQFVPFEVDYWGKVIGNDCLLSDYIWYSIISLETILCNKQDLPYDTFCEDYRKHMDRDWDDPYEALRLDNGSITCSSIESFYRKTKECAPEIIESMWPFIRLTIILGQVIDPDADLSEILWAIRNDYIKSHQDYWDSVISIFYDDSDGEEIDKDILAHRLSEDGSELINYRYNHFVDEEYVGKIMDLFLEDKLGEYLEKIWRENKEK